MEKIIKLMQAQFDKMCATGQLFKSTMTGSEVWSNYINGFTKEENPIFRDPQSSTHNCNICNSFIRRYGNIVAINSDLTIMTIFDIDTFGTEYATTIPKLSNLLKNTPIQDVFFETYDELNILPYEKCSKTASKFQLGIASNMKMYNKEEAEKYGIVKEGEIKKFNHFNLSLPAIYVDITGESIEKIMADFRDNKNVFKRAMEEISLDTLNLVKDLINQNSLLDGASHIGKITTMIPFKEQYDKIAIELKDNWCWVTSYKLPIAKFKNSAIGTLCSDLSEGKELNEACKMWNKMVDPVNYMKVTAPITSKQIEEAKKFVEDNGYIESFDRRLATIEDIKTSEILHINSGDGKIKEASIFDNVKSTSTRHKKAEFDKVEEISIEKFMLDILPTCTSLEIYVENRMENNLVTLTKAANDLSKQIFKWDNNYSWSFNGNLAGKSQIKEAVKSRGGKTEAIIRISLAFPGTTDDYDLHCIEPNGNRIYYSNKRILHASSGMIDLDAQGGDGHFPPEKRVENITYSDLSKMPNGNYEIQVNNYSERGLHTKFQLEVEIEGDVTLIELEKTTQNNRTVIGTLTKQNNQVIFTPKNATIISSEIISKNIWGLETNQFHKVNLVCLTPNHWGTNNIGNKHYLFMIDKCKTTTPVRGFHNENLIGDLLTHRKVMDALGAQTMINPTDKQLSGLGFNNTIHDELIVRVQGSFKRVLKIKI